VTLPAEIANVHVFEKRLYFRAASTRGRAARIVIDRLKEDARSARCG